MVKQNKTGWGVETAKGNVLAINGEYYSQSFIGPGTGHSAKLWKTEAGAQKTAARIHGKVFRVS